MEENQNTEKAEITEIEIRRLTIDEMFKELIQLSDKEIVINLINGLFGTNYSTDAELTHLDKETVSEFEKRISDVLLRVVTDSGGWNKLDDIKIDDDWFHIEAQTSNDDTIAIRVLVYGLYGARLHTKELTDDEGFPMLALPKSMVLFLASDDKTPDVAGVTLVDGNTGNQMKLRYPTFHMSDYNAETLAKNKLYMLLPFFPMKYKGLRQKHEETYEEQAKSELSELGRIFSRIEQSNVLSESVVEEYRNTAKKVAKFILESSKHIIDKKGVTEAMDNVGEWVIEYPSILYTIHKAELKAEERAEKRAAEKTAREFVRNMLSKHLTFEQVSEYANIPLADVKRFAE